MMYMRYVLLVMVSLLADLLNLFLAPIVVLFASKDGWLPRWLSWFQTPDNSLDGDGGWQQEHRPFMVVTKPWHQWWNRTRWQWIRTLSLHSLLYLFVPEYRLASEVEAYKEQAKWYGDDRLPKYAGFIARNYRLKISEESALRLFRE